MYTEILRPLFQFGNVSFEDDLRLMNDVVSFSQQWARRKINACGLKTFTEALSPAYLHI